MLPITNHPLDQLFAANPGAFQTGMSQMHLENMFRQQQEARANANQELLRDQNERLKEKDRLEALFKQNEETRKAKEFEARLPGLQATAELSRTQSEIAKAKMPAEIEEILSKAASRGQKDQLEKMEKSGTILTQAGMLARSPGGRQAAKKFLEDQGFGQFYDPRWDQGAMNDDASIAQVLEMFGKGLTDSVAGFQQKRDLQTQAEEARVLLEQQRAESARQENERKAQERRQIEELRAQRRMELQDKINAAKKEAQGNKQSLNQLAAKLMEAAINEQDPDIKAMLQSEAAKVADTMRFVGNPPVQRPMIDPSVAPGVLTTPPEPQNPLRNNPNAAPSSGSPAQNRPQTLADLQKLYPGVPPEKLKEAYKKKFGIDLK